MAWGEMQFDDDLTEECDICGKKTGHESDCPYCSAEDDDLFDDDD